MRPSQLILICTLLVLTLATKTVTIQCVKNSTCDSGYGYSYYNSTHNDFQCISGTCPVRFKQQYGVDNCSLDINMQTCQTGMCLFANELNICVSPDQSCPRQGSGYTECGSCSDQINCANDKCFTIQGSEICTTYNDCPFKSYYTQAKNCQNDQDYYGNSCKCCAKINQFVDVKIGVCSDQGHLNPDIIEKYAAEFIQIQSVLYAILSIITLWSIL